MHGLLLVCARIRTTGKLCAPHETDLGRSLTPADSFLERAANEGYASSRSLSVSSKIFSRLTRGLTQVVRNNVYMYIIISLLRTHACPRDCIICTIRFLNPFECAYYIVITIVIARTIRLVFSSQVCSEPRATSRRVSESSSNVRRLAVCCRALFNVKRNNEINTLQYYF